MRISRFFLGRLLMVVLICFSTGTLTVGETQLVAHAKVPFEFWVGDTRLAAGDYELKHVVSPTLVVFTNKSTNIATEAYLLPVDSEPVKQSEAKLIFSVQNGSHYLYQINGTFGTRVMTAQYGAPKPTGDKRAEVPILYQ